MMIWHTKWINLFQVHWKQHVILFTLQLLVLAFHYPGCLLLWLPSLSSSKWNLGHHRAMPTPEKNSTNYNKWFANFEIDNLVDTLSIYKHFSFIYLYVDVYIWSQNVAHYKAVQIAFLHSKFSFSLPNQHSQCFCFVAVRAFKYPMICCTTATGVRLSKLGERHKIYWYVAMVSFCYITNQLIIERRENCLDSKSPFVCFYNASKHLWEKFHWDYFIAFTLTV